MSNPSPLKRGPTLEPPAGKSSGVLSYGSFTYGYKVSGIGHWVSHGCLLFLHPKLDPPLPLYAFTFTFAHGGGGGLYESRQRVEKHGPNIATGDVINLDSNSKLPYRQSTILPTKLEFFRNTRKGDRSIYKGASTDTRPLCLPTPSHLVDQLQRSLADGDVWVFEAVYDGGAMPLHGRRV